LFFGQNIEFVFLILWFSSSQKLLAVSPRPIDGSPECKKEQVWGRML
jgi:hypothetical protein